MPIYNFKCKYWISNVKCVRTVHCSHRPLSIAKSLFNRHVSIRTGPWINGRRLSGLITHLFFYFRWIAECVCIIQLRQKWQQMHYGKKASRQRPYYDLADVLLGNLGIQVNVTLTCTTSLKIVADHVPFMAMAFPDDSGPFQRDNTPATLQIQLRNGLRSIAEQGVVSNSTEHLWDVLDHQIQCTMSWCQIPQKRYIYTLYLFCTFLKIYFTNSNIFKSIFSYFHYFSPRKYIHIHVS